MALLAGLTLTALASRVRAAPAPTEHELLLFDEAVISAASKHPQVVTDAPSWVSIISREDIRRFGVRTLSEALRLVPGFYGTYDRNYDYVGVRGFLRPGDYNNRILLLINGLTYNDDIYGSAPLGYDFGIDLEAIDHIEVIRGPGSALYGGNAIFAVVNVVTATGETRPGLQVLGETGSFYRRRGQASFGRVFDNGLDVFIDGSYFAVDGPGKLFFPEFDSPETNDGVAIDLDGEWAWNFYLRARWKDLVLQGGVNRRSKDIPTASYETVFDAPGTRTLDGRQFAELLYQKDLSSELSLTGRAYYNGTMYRGTYVYAGEGEDRIDNQDRAWSNSAGAELRGQWTLADRNILTGGVEYTYHPSVTQKNFDPGEPPTVDVARSYTSWGVYLQDELRLTSWATLIGGARYDEYYGSLEQVSPRMALILRPQPSTNIKLLYGRAFRPPSVYERYYSAPSGDGAQFGNPGLGAETISTYEIDLEQDLWGGARGTLALYHYELDGLIDPFTIEQEGISGTQFQNGPSAQANGLDLELRVPLPRRCQARASFSAQRVRSQGAQLTNSPSFLGKVELLFPVPLGPIELEGAAELLVSSPRKTLAGNEVGTVNTLNLNLWYDTPIDRLALSLGLYNLLDQHYADPGGVDLVQDRIVQDGFTFRLQGRYAF